MQSRKSRDALSQQVNKLSMLSQDDQNLRNDLLARIQGLEELVSKREQELQSVQRNFESMSSMASGDRKVVKDLRAQVADVTDQLQTKTAQYKELLDIRRESVILKEDLGEAKTENSSLKSDVLKLKAELSAKTGEATSLTQKLRLSQSSVRRFQDESEKSKRNDRWVKEANEDLKKQLEAQSKQNSDLEAAFKVMEEKVVSLEEKSNRAVVDHERTLKMVEKLSKENFDLRKDLGDAANKYELLRNEYSNYQSKLDDQAAAVGYWEQRLLENNVEWEEKMKREKQEWETKADIKQRKHLEQCKFLENQNVQQRSESIRLAAENEQALREQMKLREDLEQAKLDAQREKEKVSQEKSQIVEDLQRKMADLRKQLALEESKCERLHSEVGFFKAKKSELELESSQEIERLNAELTLARGRGTDANDEVSKISLELRTTQKQLETARRKANDLTQQVQDEVGRLTLKIDEERRLRQVAENEMKSREKEYKNMAGLQGELAEKRRLLALALNKLQQADDAIDVDFTCLKCFNKMENPQTCVPCGHSFCARCAPKANYGEQPVCPECNQRVQYEFMNSTLDNIIAKFVFMKQTLEVLKENRDGY